MSTLGRLSFRPIEVVAREGPPGVVGQRARARLATCPCGCCEWVIYLLDAHQHLQCLKCGETFCDGTCSLAVQAG